MQGSKYGEITFVDECVVNSDEYDFYDKVFLIHNAGFAVCIVFARNEQGAMDEAADEGRLDEFLIPEEDYVEYGVNSNTPRCAYLGNAGEPFDIEPLDIVELPKPPFSFCALFNAYLEGKDNARS